MKKKILIVINSNNFVRNYIETKAFKIINKNYKCHYLFVKKKNYLNFKKNNNIDASYLEINKLFINFYNFKIKINFFINQYKSKTVKYLIKKLLKQKLFYRERNYFFKLNFYLRLANYLKNNINYNLRFIYISFLKFLNFFGSLYFSQIILNKIKPNLIIFPYQSDDVYFASVLRLVKKKIPFVGLVDNWDNLSSKANLEILPDLVTVWGKQSEKHAIRYQGFKKKNIFITGTPRYDNFFKLRNKKLKSKFNFKYILFLESFFCYNNSVELKILDNFLNKNLKFKNYKLIYRPHPWQKKHNINLDNLNLKSVIIDPQIKHNYINRNFDTDFQPSLNYYPSLIKNADIVITGPTSMLIESTIFRKKTLLLGYKNYADINYYDQLRNFVHLKDVQNLSNVILCKNLKNLESDIVNLFKIKQKKFMDKIDEERNFYLFHSKEDYSSRLNRIISSIVR